MNTYTNSVHPKKAVSQTTHNRLVNNSAIMTFVLALVIVAAIAIYLANRPVVAKHTPSVTYGNALEMQYAQPWLAANKSDIAYNNALELQYARPWLDAQNKPIVAYGNALELQYAQPWLDAQNKPIVAYGNALEMQYAQPWQLPIVVTGDAREQTLLDCHSSLELFYACKYGYGRP